MRRLWIPLLVVVVLGLGVGAWVSTRGKTATSTTTTSTTTTIHPDVAPLTGLVDPSGASRGRPALTVKIENTPEAMPQWGIDQADVVYEEIVNGGITRLAAIFNSHAPAKVGPVRSVRPTDTSVVWPLGGIFAYSGGAAYAIQSISTVPSLKLIDESSAGAAMFRDPTRYAPHNLYADAVLLMAKGGTPKPPPALFTYSSGTKRTPGVRVRSFVVGFAAGYATTFAWNPKTLSWDRSIFGAPDVTASRVQLSPKNVIVMFVHYIGGVGVIGSEALLNGHGIADVFTGGTVQRANWTRAGLRHPIVYRGSNGRIIALHPGQTWVELLDTSEQVSIVSIK